MECGGTGFIGRMAICELLDLTDKIRELILDRRSSAEIKRAARDEGMMFLRESAVNKAVAGRTTLQEINKVTFVEVARRRPRVSEPRWGEDSRACGAGCWRPSRRTWRWRSGPTAWASSGSPRMESRAP
jgi:hypothetical protein